MVWTTRVNRSVPISCQRSNGNCGDSHHPFIRFPDEPLRGAGTIAALGKEGNTRELLELLAKRPWDAKRLPGERIRRALAELGRPELCEDCGTGPQWRGRTLTLEVDHVNGDRSDNRPENLRLLCPNCHAVTPTYCRKKAGASSAARQVA
ncbi:HNH endonuclease signature motif containing protein [Kitasatospora azatica]|uniref:HNH endonuclease signature motif containing protein n=1 Tax=Kitasatospora azatica TaxID=58347 RepID=UPI000A000499|nr:HNH endonuclease signature motif containing protein [Kitasatospora azatica]